MAKTPYASAGWRAVRLMVLDRDAHRCRIQLAGCAGIADTVDHIQPIELGGAWLDPLNLRAACTHCNSARGNATRTDRGAGLPPSRDW